MALGAVSVVFLPTEPAWKVPVPDPADPGELFLPQLLTSHHMFLQLPQEVSAGFVGHVWRFVGRCFGTVAGGFFR